MVARKIGLQRNATGSSVSEVGGIKAETTSGSPVSLACSEMAYWVKARADTVADAGTPVAGLRGRLGWRLVRATTGGQERGCTQRDHERRQPGPAGRVRLERFHCGVLHRLPGSGVLR